MVQFDSTTSNDIHHYCKYDIDISICPKEMNGLPANKKVKTGVDSSAAIHVDDDKNWKRYMMFKKDTCISFNTHEEDQKEQVMTFD